MIKESKPIFISHAVADKEIADAICDLLSTGMGINAEEYIFCSSLEGLGIPSGSNFVDFIKKELKNTKLVILLLSENYFSSQFCMAELGASWIQSNQTIPLIVPPLQYSDMKAVLTGVQARIINETSAWNEISDEVKDLFSLSFKTNRWIRKQGKFLKDLNPLLKGQPKPSIVPASKLIEVEDRLNEANSDLENLEKKIEEQDELIEALKACKNKKEVTEVELSHFDELEAFEQLCEDSKQTISSLSSNMGCILFSYFSFGEVYKPSEATRYDWSDIDSGCNYSYLTSDDDGIDLMEEHPRIREVIDSVEKLKSFIRENEEILSPIIEHKYGFLCSVSDLEFWDEFL